MKKIFYLLVAATLVVAVPVQAQNIKKAKRNYEKQKALEELRMQYRTDSMRRANELAQQAQIDSLKRERELRELQHSLNKDFEVELPGAEFANPPKGIIRSNVTEGIGKSKDRLIAGKQARAYAVASLASKISVAVANSTKGTLKDNAENERSHNEKVFVDALKEMVMQEIQGYRTCFEKFTQSVDGSYNCYVIVEIDTTDMQKIHNRLGDEGILRTDYNFERFQADLEEEIKKYEATHRR